MKEEGAELGKKGKRKKDWLNLQTGKDISWKTSNDSKVFVKSSLRIDLFNSDKIDSFISQKVTKYDIE